MEKKETILKFYKEYVSENIIPTKEYLNNAKKFSKEIEDLSKVLSPEDDEKLNNLYECMMEMIKEECAQAFVEGYSLGVKLTTEALYDVRKTEMLQNK